jgi:sucrose-6-phosphate hydrolase SacC (GH32 family)
LAPNSLGTYSKDDMVHWEDMPVALAPEAGSETPDGAWAGNAVVDDSGNPALFFTAGNDKATPIQATRLARSTFKDDGDTWYQEQKRQSSSFACG